MVSQGKSNALTKLLAVVGVSRQAYYKVLNREETAWEARNRQLEKHSRQKASDQYVQDNVLNQNFERDVPNKV